MTMPIPLTDASVRIRTAGPHDCAQLTTLCAEHAAFERIPFDPAGHSERLQEALERQPPQLHAWLALHGEKAVGYATATVDFATLSGRPFLHMDCLYVKAAARNAGIGARLMQQVQARGQRLGCATLQWQTPDWNTAAQRFYLRSGARALAKLRFTLALP